MCNFHHMSKICKSLAFSSPNGFNCDSWGPPMLSFSAAFPQGSKRWRRTKAIILPSQCHIYRFFQRIHQNNAKNPPQKPCSTVQKEEKRISLCLPLCFHHFLLNLKSNQPLSADIKCSKLNGLRQIHTCRHGPFPPPIPLLLRWFERETEYDISSPNPSLQHSQYSLPNQQTLAEPFGLQQDLILLGAFLSLTARPQITQTFTLS